MKMSQVAGLLRTIADSFEQNDYCEMDVALLGAIAETCQHAQERAEREKFTGANYAKGIVPPASGDVCAQQLTGAAIGGE